MHETVNRLLNILTTPKAVLRPGVAEGSNLVVNLKHNWKLVHSIDAYQNYNEMCFFDVSEGCSTPPPPTVKEDEDGAFKICNIYFF